MAPLALDHERTALLLLDLSNDVLHPDGAVGKIGVAKHVENDGTVDRIVSALEAARSVGLEVAHIGVGFRPGHPDINPRNPLMVWVREDDFMVEGTWGSESYPPVAPVEGEVTFAKKGISAFTGTDLDHYLRAKDIIHLVLSGIATNFVVEATAFSGVDHGFGVTVLTDACTSFDAFQHHFAVEHVFPRFASLCTVAEFADAIGSNR